MPERSRSLNPARRRDVEDACFETVSAPRDVFVSRPAAGAAGGVFKSRMTQPATDGPIPRDFAGRSGGTGERLGVFANEQGSAMASRIMSPLTSVAVVVCAVLAIAAFWMAGGQAMVGQPETRQPVAANATPPALMPDRVVLPPDPVVTSSVPVVKAKPAAGGFSAPLPRPARIERAGSILMIRPAGD